MVSPPARRRICAVSLVLLVGPSLVGCSEAGGLPRIPESHYPQVLDDWVSVHADAAKSFGDDVPGAPGVQLLVFSDFQCRSCGLLEPVLAELRDTFGDALIVRWAHFPLLGHVSEAAAMASECARMQGLGDRFRSHLFANAEDLPLESWEVISSEAGIPDPNRLKRCMADPEIRRIIRGHWELGRRVGVTATPTLLLDSLLFTGSPGMRYLHAYTRLSRQVAP